MTQKTSLSQDPTIGETQYGRENDTVPFEFPVEGVVSTLTSPTMKMFKRGSTTDVSSTYFTGSMSVSGFSILSKTPQNLKAGNWIISVSATVDGYVRNVVVFEWIIKREGEL